MYHIIGTDACILVVFLVHPVGHVLLIPDAK